MAAKSLRQTHREYERVLTAMFGLLIGCGLNHKAISELTDRAFKSAIAKARAFNDPGEGELATIGLVLDAWHRDRHYLTATGKPKAVRLLGRAPSVQALIRAEGLQLDTVELARRIESLGLITSCPGGCYRPTRDSAVISSGPPLLQYVARCLMSLVETAESNLRGAPNVPPLLQRSAEVPDLPAERVRSFQTFSRFQGEVFVRTINDWLETRRVRARRTNAQKNVRAGVYVHAYVASNSPRASVRTSTSPKRALT